MDPVRARRRGAIAHLGPAWISAIAAGVSALAAVGFFAVRAGSPSSDGSTSSPPAAAATRSASSAHSTAAAGTQLTQYTIDVAAGYGFDISDRPARPTRPPVDLSLPVTGQIYASRVEVAPLDAPTPTYEACVANTRFTNPIFVDRGDVFCVTGHGYIAGVKVTADTGSYNTFVVTVWQRS